MNDTNIKKAEMTGGDILAYRPRVSMSKEVDTLHKEDPMEPAEEKEPLYHYSKPVMLMSQSLPSGVISSMEEGVSDIDSYMSTVERKLIDTKVQSISFLDYKTALANGDTDTVDTYMGYHFNDIKGNTNVEVYNGLHDLRKELVEFKSTFTKLTYGQDEIASEVATDTDKVRMDKLFELEHTESFNRINYAALNSDVQINRISSAYAHTLKSCASSLYVLSLQDTYEDIDDSKGHISNTINKSFNNASIKSAQDRTRANQSTNTNLVVNSLVGAANGRTELLDALHAKHKLQDLPSAAYFIDTIDKTFEEAEAKSLNKMVDFNKSVLLSSLNKDDNITSIKEKSDLRNIFRSIK